MNRDSKRAGIGAAVVGRIFHLQLLGTSPWMCQFYSFPLFALVGTSSDGKPHQPAAWVFLGLKNWDFLAVGGGYRGEGRRGGRGIPGKQREQGCREWGAAGTPGTPPPPAHSSTSPFTPRLGIFLQPLHVPLCSPVASGQNRPVLCIYPLKCHPDESCAPPQGTAGFQACWLWLPFLSPFFF